MAVCVIYLLKSFDLHAVTMKDEIKGWEEREEEKERRIGVTLRK